MTLGQQKLYRAPGAVPSGGYETIIYYKVKETGLRARFSGSSVSMPDHVLAMHAC